MDEITLSNYLRNISNCSKVQPITLVVASDELSSIPNTRMPIAFVSNDSKRSEPGKQLALLICFVRARLNIALCWLLGNHWLLFMLLQHKRPNQKRVLEIFDSLGQPFVSYNIKLPSYLEKCKIIENRRPIQSQYSSFCGFHVGYLLYQRLRGRKFMDIINQDYSCNLRYNDKIARKLFRKFCATQKRQWLI